MAVRVRNGSSLSFSALSAETAISHYRLCIGPVILATKALPSSVTIAAGRGAEFLKHDIVITFNSNDLDDAGYNAVLAEFFDGSNEVNVDLMTDASTIVSTSGYSQVAFSNWVRDVVSD